METVRIHKYSSLPLSMQRRIRDAQKTAAAVWTFCRDSHKKAREESSPWPGRNELQTMTKGNYPLHSQSIQMICHAFLVNVETTRQNKLNGDRKARYPHRDKRFYPLSWPAQAVAVQHNRVVLPMGRGRQSLTLPLPEGFIPGACKLVWGGDCPELHVTVAAQIMSPDIEATQKATVDLGQIHLAAVTTDDGHGLVVSGREIRSRKRQLNKVHADLAYQQSRCKRKSRRWWKLQSRRNRLAAREKRRIRDIRHKATRSVIDFCTEHKVGTLFIGNPAGVRNGQSGRKQNQRMSQWEYGRDIDYLQQKAARTGIESFTGSERGTSSRCPRCGNRHKPKGRNWHCRACGFTGHRDLVGSANMHQDNFGSRIPFPAEKDTTYLRPLRRRSSSQDTGHDTKCAALLFWPRQRISRTSGASQEAGLGLGHQTETHPL